MNSDREEILQRLRGHGRPAVALPAMPAFAQPSGTTGEVHFERFAAALQRMGGRLAEWPQHQPLAALVATLFPGAAVVASATDEVPARRTPQDLRATAGRGMPADLHDVDLGVVRALAGVAETGSLLLSETEFIVPALGFLSQHLLVLLDPRDIVRGLHDIYQHPRMAQSRYQVLLTGPSATADIEGVLIHGAQGVRSLTVLLRPRP